MEQLQLDASGARDPLHLRKASQSLRVQLSQPLTKTVSTQQLSDHPGSTIDGSLTGTRSGPYSGYASERWLQEEVRRDVSDLKQAVDIAVTRREKKTFELERTALQGEIASLRKRLEAAELRCVQLERLLPKDNASFDHLRRTIETLDKECDGYCDLLDDEERRRKTAERTIHDALGQLEDIDQEFTRIRAILDRLPGGSNGDPDGFGTGSNDTAAAGVGARGGPGEASGRLAAGAGDTLHIVDDEMADAGKGPWCGCFGGGSRRQAGVTRQAATSTATSVGATSGRLALGGRQSANAAAATAAAAARQQQQHQAMLAAVNSATWRGLESDPASVPLKQQPTAAAQQQPARLPQYPPRAPLQQQQSYLARQPQQHQAPSLAQRTHYYEPPQAVRL